MMKKIAFLLCMSALILSACTSSEDGEENVIAKEYTLHGTMELPQDVGQKTALGEGNVVNWTLNDPIKVFGGTTPAKFVATSISGTSADFKGEFSGTPTHALYPYQEGATLSGSTITFNLPDVQYYKPGSFGEGANVAVGAINGKNIAFKNVLGVLKLSLTGSDKIDKIVLTDKGTNMLWGEFTVEVDADDPKPAVYSKNGSKSITLDCSKVEGGGVQLTSNPTLFYIAVPAGALSDGFDVYIHKVNAVASSNVQATKANTIKRSIIKAMPTIEVKEDWTYTRLEYTSSGDNNEPKKPVGGYIKSGVYVEKWFKAVFDAKYVDAKRGTEHTDHQILFGCAPKYNGVDYYYQPVYWNQTESSGEYTKQMRGTFSFDHGADEYSPTKLVEYRTTAPVEIWNWRVKGTVTIDGIANSLTYAVTDNTGATTYTTTRNGNGPYYKPEYLPIAENFPADKKYYYTEGSEIYIFTCNRYKGEYNLSDFQKYCARAKIYSLKFYGMRNGEETLIHDFVPYRRTNGSVTEYGFVDDVTKVFHGPAADGVAGSIFGKDA